ncbi:MAG TPA: Hint domain-containing protein [Longimicrobium sp.]|nr:Hint domain-containing protein [Longimicrobium sp.]
MSVTDSWGRPSAPLSTEEIDLLNYVRGLAQPCPFRPGTKVLPLDLNDEGQRRFFEARFGTPADLGRFFPQKQQIFDATAAWQRRNGVATRPQSVHLPPAPSDAHPNFVGWRPATAPGAAVTGYQATAAPAGPTRAAESFLLGTTWQPAAFIAAVDYRAGTGMSQAGASAVLTVPGVMQLNELTLEIVDLTAYQVVATSSTGPQKQAYLTVGAQGSLAAPGNAIGAYAAGYYVPSGSSFAVPVLTLFETGSMPGEASASEEERSQPSLALVITDPVNKVTPQGSPIRVALSRDDQIPDCDYYYGGNAPNPNPNIQLAVTGTATAPAGNTFDPKTATNVNGSLITISRNGGASVTFPPEQIPPAVTSATSVLTWSMNPAQYQGPPPWSSGDTVDLFFTLNVAMNNSPGGVPNVSIFVTSDPSTPPGMQNTYVSPPLQFMWGCLAEDEPVRMADGTLRPVRDVRIGEQVRTAGGGALRVVNLTRGREPIPMLRIVTEDGRAGRMTEGHPVRTDAGWTRARDVAPGDRVETEAGMRTVTTVEPFRYDGEVRNLVLAPADGPADDLDAADASFFASGLLVGDNRLQARTDVLAREAAGRRGWTDDPAWRHDVENFRRLAEGLPLVAAAG